MKKRRGYKKERGNCKDLGHTCIGLKETGRDVRMGVTLLEEREESAWKGTLFRESNGYKGM